MAGGLHVWLSVPSVSNEAVVSFLYVFVEKETSDWLNCPRPGLVAERGRNE